MEDFARVLEIPATAEIGHHPYCFGGPQPYPVNIVDWFDARGAWPADVDHDQWRKELAEFIANKRYIRPGKHYVIVCDSGDVIAVTGPARTVSDAARKEAFAIAREDVLREAKAARDKRRRTTDGDACLIAKHGARAALRKARGEQS